MKLRYLVPIALVLGACTPPATGPQPEGGSLRAFRSEKELREFSLAIARQRPNPPPPPAPVIMPAPEPVMPDSRAPRRRSRPPGRGSPSPTCSTRGWTRAGS